MHRLNDINHTNLKVVLTHVGADVGEDGKTHQCVDYINLTRNLFHFNILCPADPNQTDRIFRWLINKPGNYIVAMGRSKLSIIRKEDGTPYYGIDYNFEPGKQDLLRDGKNGTIFVCGTPVGNALKAVDNLRLQGIYPRLVYIASPLLIDQEIIEDAQKTGVIFTIEDHSIHGGLGTSVAEKIVQSGLSCPLVKIGVADYPISGNSTDLYQKLGLDSVSIASVIKQHV
ncbi:MAG: transketolase C-terminal domain-containing protein, partial [Candidatus Cloacimonadaceae bacterium]|nr:transketolase C-terminal domain-containing protein [Candidatus Cloacimonadaceae bacterium]